MPDPAKTAHETETKHSRGLGSYVVWAFVVVMVYVLSSGPMMRYKHHFNRWMITIYMPLVYAYSIKPIQKPLGLYWHLWCPQVFDANGNSDRPY